MCSVYVSVLAAAINWCTKLLLHYWYKLLLVQIMFHQSHGYIYQNSKSSVLVLHPHTVYRNPFTVRLLSQPFLGVLLYIIVQLFPLTLTVVLLRGTQHHVQVLRGHPEWRRGLQWGRWGRLSPPVQRGLSVSRWS